MTQVKQRRNSNAQLLSAFCYSNHFEPTCIHETGMNEARNLQNGTNQARKRHESVSNILIQFVSQFRLKVGHSETCGKCQGLRSYYIKRFIVEQACCESQLTKPTKFYELSREQLARQIRIFFRYCTRSLVRPILEYAAPVWSPIPRKNAKWLELEKKWLD